MWKRGTDCHLRVDTNSTQGILSCSVFNQSHSEPGKFLSLFVEIYVPSPHTAYCLTALGRAVGDKTGRGLILGNTVRRATVVVLREEVCRHFCSSSDTRIVVIIKGETKSKASSSLLWVLRRPATIGNNAQYHTVHMGMAVLGFELRLPCYTA